MVLVPRWSFWWIANGTHRLFRYFDPPWPAPFSSKPPNKVPVLSSFGLWLSKFSICNSVGSYTWDHDFVDCCLSPWFQPLSDWSCCWCLDGAWVRLLGIGPPLQASTLPGELVRTRSIWPSNIICGIVVCGSTSEGGPKAWSTRTAIRKEAKSVLSSDMAGPKVFRTFTICSCPCQLNMHLSSLANYRLTLDLIIKTYFG